MAKDLITCTLVTGLFEPSLDAGITRFDAAPLVDFDYYFGWLVFNTSNNAIPRYRTMTLSSPPSRQVLLRQHGTGRNPGPANRPTLANRVGGWVHMSAGGSTRNVIA